MLHVDICDTLRHLVFCEKSLVGKDVVVKLKNDLSICGTLHSVDQYQNIKLTDTSVIDPHMSSVKSDYIRGSVVRYVQLPSDKVYPDKGPFHIAAPWLNPKYDYPSFLKRKITVRKIQGISALLSKNVNIISRFLLFCFTELVGTPVFTNLEFF